MQVARRQPYTFASAHICITKAQADRTGAHTVPRIDKRTMVARLRRKTHCRTGKSVNRVVCHASIKYTLTVYCRLTCKRVLKGIREETRYKEDA